MSATGVSGESYSTYFETLPDEVHVKLVEWVDMVWYESSENVQYLDTLPFTGKGRHFLSFLFSENGPFCKALSSVLTKVTLSSIRNSTNVSVDGGWVNIGPEILEGEELGRGVIERVLRACGESMKEIVLAVDDVHPLLIENGEYRIIQQFVSLVIQYCPAVESLEFDLPFSGEDVIFVLFAKYCSQLCSIDGYMWKSGVTLYSADFSNCTQIRCLSLPATPQLIPLLEGTGSLLERLFLRFDSFEGYGEVLDAIEQNCKKLVHIGLDDSRRVINSVGEERYAAFLCSYGTQLTSASLQGMVESEHLLEVYSKCSNLDVKYQSIEDYGIEGWELVRVFGPRIQHVKVDMFACTGVESCNAISSCISLSGLELFNFGRDRISEQDVIDTTLISVLSSLSTPSLERLLLPGLRGTKENLAMIVAATSNLRSLKLELAQPVQNGAFFKTIADSNPYLREVRIVEDEIEDGIRDGDSAVELLRELVNTFSKCRSLIFGILNTGDQEVREETIRDICASLPCRGIDLYVRIGCTSCGQPRRLGDLFLISF